MVNSMSELLTEWTTNSPAEPATQVSGFGLDLFCWDDLAEDVRLVQSDAESVAQNIFRRLSTERGSLEDDPDYGLDIRQFLHKGMDRRLILAFPSQINNEIQKEDRVLQSSVKFGQFTENKFTIIIRVAVDSGRSFELTCNVTQAAITLLGVEFS